MTKAPTTPTVVSAPGKVLILGGYLVLDPAYSGCSLAVDARFYAKVCSVGVQDPSSIIVTSPQFSESSRFYTVGNSVTFEPSRSEDRGKNPFVDAALTLCLRYYDKPLTDSLAITILGDNDFYSQVSALQTANQKLGSKSLARLPKCNAFGVPLSQVHKTGLGSSAALTASLVGALLLHLGCVSKDGDSLTSQSLRIVHNFAQMSHCIAQGKIGSGFDVSSAVFGSQIYTRFNPDVLSTILKKNLADLEPSMVAEVVDSLKWDAKIEEFFLPPGVGLILADIDGGSNTPGLVSKLLEWRRNNSEKGNEIWTTLNAANSTIIEILRELNDTASANSEYAWQLQLCSQYRASQLKYLELASPSDLMIDLSDIHTNFETIRSCFRELGELAKIPIEPKEQTELLNKSLEIPGVLIAGVPGAGGFDAIFCLTLSDKARDALDKLWSDLGICALTAKESSTGLQAREWRLAEFPPNHAKVMISASLRQVPVNFENSAVVLEYADLVDPRANVSEAISTAFGANDLALGIILIRGIPGYTQLREKFLPMGSKLAHLPQNVLDGLEHPESKFMVGWSYGKEIMNGKPDVSKGSFYANPSVDVPFPDAATVQEFPEYASKNAWPPEWPTFRELFRKLGHAMLQVGTHVASRCDSYLETILPNHPTKFLSDMVESSICNKARLLHYFPQTPTGDDTDMDSWCGWHLDHSCITALTRALYVDESDSDNFVISSCPDPSAGLYIRNRNGDIVKVDIPEDCMAFQTGEALEIASSGLLKATPHCVRGISDMAYLNESRHLARNTLALFIQPNLDQELAPGYSFSRFTKDIVKRHYK